MVTLDGNLSNPLDQKLHTLLGHLQYISPSTTILYISHSLHNHQYITQPTQQHTTYTIHIQPHLHTTTTLYTQLHGHVDIHAGLMHSHAGLMQSHAGLMQAHADPMQAVMQSHVLSTPILLILLSITHLIQGLSFFSSLYTPFLLTGCAYTWPEDFFSPHFWLFHCVPWHFQASTNPSV